MFGEKQVQRPLSSAISELLLAITGLIRYLAFQISLSETKCSNRHNNAEAFLAFPQIEADLIECQIHQPEQFLSGLQVVLQSLTRWVDYVIRRFSGKP
jgi:hypothetical protein